MFEFFRPHALTLKASILTIKRAIAIRMIGFFCVVNPNILFSRLLQKIQVILKTAHERLGPTL